MDQQEEEKGRDNSQSVGEALKGQGAEPPLKVGPRTKGTSTSLELLRNFVMLSLTWDLVMSFSLVCLRQVSLCKLRLALNSLGSPG